MASFVARTITAVEDLADAPGAPTGVEVAVEGTAGNQLSVSWSAPADDGGAEITGYVVQWKSGDEEYDADDRQASTSDLSWTTPAGLTSGTEYTFRVAAENSAGQGDWSAEAAGSPGTAPGRVGNLAATAGNKSLTISWAAPEDDGGTAITGYTVIWRAGRGEDMETEIGATTSHTITGLTNGTAYRVQVRATNGAGTGDAATLNPSATTTPKPVAPELPASIAFDLNDTDTTDTTVTVTPRWTAPADNGGRPIERYVTRQRILNRAGDPLPATGGSPTPAPENGGWTAWVPVEPDPTLWTIGPAITTALGETVEFEVRADNTTPAEDTALGATDTSIGQDKGLGKPVKSSVLAAIKPGAPTLAATGVVGHHRSLGVSWTAGVDNGSPLTGFKVLVNDGGGDRTYEVNDASASSYIVTGLVNGAQYSVTVKATNAKGDSDASASHPGTPAPAPGVPRNVRVANPPQTESDGFTVDNEGTNLDVSWDAPADNGTAALRVAHPTAGEGNVPATATVAVGPPTGYAVEYRTAAIAGNTDTVCPTQPTGADPATIAASDTGCAAGGWVSATVEAANVASRTLELTDLTAGIEYDVRVAATNNGGLATGARQGPWSGSVSETPANLPGAVAFDTATVQAESGSLTLTWLPAEANGAEITEYEVRHALNPNGRWSGWTSISGDAIKSPVIVHRIEGLTQGLSYSYSIRAVNRIGDGPEIDRDDATAGVQSPFVATAAAIPAPRNVKVVPKLNGNGSQFTVSWDRLPASVASAAGGRDVDFVVEYYRTTADNGTAIPYPAADASTVTVTSATNRLTDLCDVASTTTVTESCGATRTSVDITVDGTPANADPFTAPSQVGQTYVVRVQVIYKDASTTLGLGLARGAFGYGPAVKSASVPIAPGSIEASYQAATKAVIVNWSALSGTAAEGVTGYFVRWYPSTNGAPGSRGNATVTGADSSTYTINRLATGTYYIEVRAINAIGNGAAAALVAGTAGSARQAGEFIPVP